MFAVLASGGKFRKVINVTEEIKNDIKTSIVENHPDIFSEFIFLPKRKFTMNPSKGRSITK